MSQPVLPTLDQIAVKVKTFLDSVVPTGTPVIRGPVNRVALPAAPSVIFTFLFQNRIRTNQHTEVDPFPSPGGVENTEMAVKVTVQMDFYGPQSNEWAAAAEMLWRDEYACNMLSPEATPLYTDDARMVPLVTSEEQYWERYTVTAYLQWNVVTSVAQQFASVASVTLINVDEAYPA